MKVDLEKNKIKYLFGFIASLCLMLIFYVLISNLYFEMIKLNHKERTILMERIRARREEIENSINRNKEEKRELKYIRKVSGYNVIAELEIPEINLKEDVLEKHSEETENLGITKFFGCNPNEVGNMCISAHNYRINGNDMFSKLKKIDIRDEIILTDGYGKKIKYIVYDIFRVFPKETESLSQKTKGKREITLITCTSDSAKRIIVKAIEMEEL